MSISDKIQIISIICTSVLSTIAIIISVLTLLQNNKMIFENNKPYITIFSKVINFTSPHTYLILKNFGLSGATILSVTYDEILNTYFKRKPFEHMRNIFIAPNQSYIYPLDFDENIDKSINFKIKYQYLNKIYTETHIVNFIHYKDICFIKTHTSKDLEELSEILQEMTIQEL